MDVAADGGEVADILDQVCAGPILKEMAGPAVAPVEILREAAIQPVQTLAEIHAGRLYEQVIMVRHQHERVNDPPVSLDSSGEEL